MTIAATENPIPLYFDTDGTPLDNGSIYFGQAGQNPETAPITVYWDSAGTQPAAQPIKTINGQTTRNGTPSVVYAGSDYSNTVRNKRGKLVSNFKQASGFSFIWQLLTSVGASLVGFIQSGAGAVLRTVQDKLRDTVNLMDFIPTALQPAILNFTSTVDVQVYIQAAIDCAVTLGGANITAPAGKFNIGATVNWKSYVNFYGVYGETPSSGVSATSGTVFNWTGSLSLTSTMFSFVNTRECEFNGLSIKGNGATGLTAILYDSTDGSAAECIFTRFAIRECLIGVQWGTTGLGAAWAAQGAFKVFTIWSSVANSIGFVVNSGNVGQQCLIEHGGIQTQLIGIDLIVTNLLQIKRVFGGTKMSTAFIRAGYAQDILIEGCECECWGSRAGSTWRSNDSYFLKVVPPVSGLSLIPTFAIVMSQNQVNNPILVTSPCRIVSLGDSWGFCEDATARTAWVTAHVYSVGDLVSVGVRNYQCLIGHTSGVFATDLASGDWQVYSVPASGTCTTSGVSRILALNNGTTSGSIDISTGAQSGMLTQGWIDGAYVDLTILDPGQGWIVPAFNAANYVANSGTWTVTAPQVAIFAWYMVGRTMTVTFRINASSLSATPSLLTIKIPNGKAASKDVMVTCLYSDSGVTNNTALCYVGSGGTVINFQKATLANWTTGTNTLVGQISFEVA